MDLAATPLWEFGFGLSYTDFKYSDLRIEPAQIDQHGAVRVSLDVENTGQIEGQEVVQLYLKHGISSVVTPVKELKGFAKVSLEPGQARRVEFSLNAKDLSVLDNQLRRVVEPGRFEVQLGASSEGIRLKGSFVVSAE